MALYSFHRVLICFAIAFDSVFTWYCIRKYNRYGEFSELVFAGLSSIASIGFVIYLVHFNRKVTKLREAMAARDRLCPGCGYDLRGSLSAQTSVCPECGAPISEEFRRRAAS